MIMMRMMTVVVTIEILIVVARVMKILQTATALTTTPTLP